MKHKRINRRRFVSALGSGALMAGRRALQGGQQPSSGRRLPNVVIIYADDLGYADVGPFGARGIDTPNLDGMARAGRRFTSFYVAQPVCSASRTALLTGCYPNRVGIVGALGPKSSHGISDGELTLGQLLKTRDYTTAIYGKWHLGHLPQFLPTRHGFDEYFGLPYSNDMWPMHPEAPQDYPPLPLMEGEKVVATNPSMDSLTTLYTERAVSFIDRSGNRPFFLYLAHSMPHVPLGVSSKFKGKSSRGLYGDVIMEIDWSVGEVFDAIRRRGLEADTLCLFASDNGPWLSYGDHAGSAGPLREGKGTTWEGGIRVPCIARWPGRIPAGSACDEPAMTIDILPTLARLTGAELPHHTIDGLNIWPLFSGEAGAQCPHDAYYFYWNDALEAIRAGRWKMHFPHTYSTLAGRSGGSGGRPAKYESARTGIALFDLERDNGEREDVASRYPEAVERLKKVGSIFDEAMKRNKREPGHSA
jgi:arylsulfatase A-like enzyme